MARRNKEESGLPMMNGIGEFYKLPLLLGTKKELALRPEQFIQLKESYEQGESEMDLTKMIKNDKTSKDPKGVRAKLDKNDIIPI